MYIYIHFHHSFSLQHLKCDYRFWQYHESLTFFFFAFSYTKHEDISCLELYI